MYLADIHFSIRKFSKIHRPTVVGNEIANVPKHSATFWTTYDFLEKWQVGGGPTYVGSRYSNNANANRVPGFVRWDSTIAYQITKNIQLRVNAINLTNQLYFDSVARIESRACRRAHDHRQRKFQVLRSLTRMIVQVPNVLNPEQLARCREVMHRASWIDGRVTAGYQSAVVKDNRQLPENSPEARELGDMIVASPGAQPAVYHGGVAAPGLPAAVQPLRRRRIVRRASGQFDPADSRHAAIASARIFPRRCFSARRKTTTAASW